MKKIFYVSLMVAMVIMASCKKESKESSTHPLYVHIQSSFNQDKVKVLLDGRTILDETMQTNYVIGVCAPNGMLSLNENEGAHQLRVILNGNLVKTDNFALSDSLYIGVNYDRQENKLSFNYSVFPFTYD